MSVNSYDSAADPNNNLVEKITHLPHKILKYHEVDALHQIVLHDLCHSTGFGLKRAIYMVDNPDFDYLKGVAGFCNKECCLHKHNVWQEPDTFKKDMKEASFHNDARRYLRMSLKRKDIDITNSSEVKDLGRDMGLEHPQFIAWGMKYGNHGLLMFEKEKDLCIWRQGLLFNAVALLSLCGL